MEYEYTKNGKAYELSEDPYMDGPVDDGYFTAHAKDDEGNEYMLKWEIIEDVRQCDDMSEMCNWEEFTVRKLNLDKYTAEYFGYKGHESLLEPNTGYVNSADDWALTCRDWVVGRESINDKFSKSIEEQFSSLIEVEFDKKSETWVEV